MFYRKLTLILFTLFIINLPLSKVKAEPPFSPGTNNDGGLSYAGVVYNAANGEMEKKWRALERLEIEYAMLGVQWNDNQQEMIKNAIRAGNAVQLDLLGASTATVTNMAESMIDINDQHTLGVKMVNKAIEIETQNVAVKKAVDKQGSAHAHYKVHYDAWVKKFSGSKEFIERGSTPGSVDIGDPGVTCKNPKCTTIYYASGWGINNIIAYAESKHLVTCSYQHASPISYTVSFSGKHTVTGGGQDRPTPPPYWNCPHDPNDCPESRQHKLACRGGCGDLFAQYGWTGKPADYPHRTKACPEQVYKYNVSLSGYWDTSEKVSCPGKLYACTNQSSDKCSYKNWHIDDDEGSSTSAALSPSGGSYTASAGSTHTANLNLPSGYQYVYWYIAGPGIDGLGLQMETDYGYGSSTTADFSWSIPSYASGDHVITAYIYMADWSIVQHSYTVTVGSGSSTDTTTTSTTTTTDTSSTTDDDSSTTSTSPYSLSASSTETTLYSGNTLTLTLSGYESMYSVDWYLEESPQYSTSISISSDYADGHGKYDSSASYTFSSGYTGDFVFKVVVYTMGNMTRYEHTYTVNVPY